MKPAYYQRQNASREGWMISYVDVLTILLILFVAMAARALQSTPPAPRVVFAARPTVAAPLPAVNEKLTAIQEELEQSHLDVQLNPRGLVISLPQALLFAPGEDRISEAAFPAVDAIARVLGRIPNNVSLVGHADAVPIHNRRFADNWELAAARGLRLLTLLSTRYGIAESRFAVESLGSYDPLDTNDTPGGRASNRRVEIVILDSAAKSAR